MILQNKRIHRPDKHPIHMSLYALRQHSTVARCYLLSHSTDDFRVIVLHCPNIAFHDKACP